MKKWIMAAFLALGVFALLFSCGCKKEEKKEEPRYKDLEIIDGQAYLTVGQMRVVTVKTVSNGEWSYTVSPEEGLWVGIVPSVRTTETTKKKDKDRVGNAGKQTYGFKALAPGVYEVEMLCRRPGQSEIPSSQDKKFTITVTE